MGRGAIHIILLYINILVILYYIQTIHWLWIPQYLFYIIHQHNIYNSQQKIRKEKLKIINKDIFLTLRFTRVSLINVDPNGDNTNRKDL